MFKTLGFIYCWLKSLRAGNEYLLWPQLRVKAALLFAFPLLKQASSNPKNSIPLAPQNLCKMTELLTGLRGSYIIQMSCIKLQEITLDFYSWMHENSRCQIIQFAQTAMSYLHVSNDQKIAAIPNAVRTANISQKASMLSLNPNKYLRYV